MVTVNNPTGTVMAIYLSARGHRDCARRAARLFARAARRFDSGDFTDRTRCVIIDGPFYPAHGAGCLSATHFFFIAERR